MRYRFLFLLCVIAFNCGASAYAAAPDPVSFGNSIEMGDLRAAGEWLDQGLDPNFAADRLGSGLMIGAWEGNVPMMELFLRHGADINFVSATGEQALMLAAWKGRAAAVRWLLAHGAQINRHGRQWSALHYAVFAGQDEVAKILIEAGADINALSSNGSSVLMMAAREGREDLARELLRRGADKTPINDWGDNAFSWAMKVGNVQIAQVLSSTRQFTQAVRAAPQLPPPVRSEPAPKPISTLLEDLRAARAAGRSVDEVLRAYQKALDEFKHAPATTATTAAPKGLVIRAKRARPEQESATLVYGPAMDLPPRAGQMSELVEQLRAARASGKSINEVLDAHEKELSAYRAGVAQPKSP